MRRSLFAATALLSFFVVACGEVIPKVTFDVDKNIPAQTIPGSFALCQFPIAVGVLGTPFNVTMSAEEDFPEQDTDVQHIEKAKLRRLTLSLTANSAEDNWDFLDSLSIFVEAEGHERRLIASIGEGTESGEPIAPGATTLDLEPEGVNLARYVKANGGFTMTSEATGCNPQENAVFDGEIRIHIVADPI